MGTLFGYMEPLSRGEVDSLSEDRCDKAFHAKCHDPPVACLKFSAGLRNLGFRGLEFGVLGFRS